VSGLSFSFDPTKQPGCRIPFESIKIKGGSLELDTQYNIATILFIYHGKNGFGIVKEGQRLNEENIAEEIHTILKKFFGKEFFFFIFVTSYSFNKRSKNYRRG